MQYACMPIPIIDQDSRNSSRMSQYIMILYITSIIKSMLLNFNFSFNSSFLLPTEGAQIRFKNIMYFLSFVIKELRYILYTKQNIFFLITKNNNESNTCLKFRLLVKPAYTENYVINESQYFPHLETGKVFLY